MPRPRRKKTALAPSTAKSTLLPASGPDALPPHLLASIFSRLRPSDIGRSASVCRGWRALISSDASAWARALPELDPFYELGPDSWRQLVHTMGGCWLRAASTLATRLLPCDACSRLSCRSAVLCRCNTRTRAGSSAAMANRGFRRRCDVHCSRSPGCVRLVSNRWLFDPQPTFTLHGDSSPASAAALQHAVRTAPAFATIRISGSFEFRDECLELWRPVRLVGAASLHMNHCCLLVLAPLVMLEDLRISVHNDPEDEGPDDMFDFEWCCCAVQVHSGSKLLTDRVHVNCEVGSALLLSDRACASLHAGTLSSLCCESGEVQCLGVIAMSATQLSMYDVAVEDTRWGVFAGDQAGLLTSYNTFSRNGSYCANHIDRPLSIADCATEGDLAPASQYPEYTGHTVQPWHGWC